MQNQDHISTPFAEKVKGVAGLFGIRTGEEPEYILKESDGNKEVRAYLPYTVVHIEITGHYEHATETAFLELADYLFGKNLSKTQMSMTLPVLQEKKGKKWAMCFVLPSRYTMATAPVPENLEIKIESRPGEVIASIEYAGINSREKIAEKKQELVQWLTKETSFAPESEPRIAQYDPPMSIPFLRRNEIQIPVRNASFNKTM
ncbi:MAG: heme-binding protein [Bdellovibrio sp.]|nr:heme-binding protein [Bdellovibrio sp.]